MENIKRIGIYANLQKPESIKLARECARQLMEMGIAVYMLEGHSQAYAIEGVRIVPADAFYRDVDLVIVLGGDGTLLNISRQAAREETPLFGINTGKLGFLTEGEGRDFKDLLHELVYGKTLVLPRMMIECTTIGPDGGKTYLALNDVVVRNAGLRMMEFHVKANGEVLGEYRADGLIVSTPTGSTAYSLSAGGPIVHPGADVLTLTAIAPQRLHDRPFVLPGSTVLEIYFESREHSIVVSMDGQEDVELDGHDILRIKKAPYVTRLVRLHSASVFERIRKKLFLEV